MHKAKEAPDLKCVFSSFVLQGQDTRVVAYRNSGKTILIHSIALMAGTRARIKGVTCELDNPLKVAIVNPEDPYSNFKFWSNVYEQFPEAHNNIRVYSKNGERYDEKRWDATVQQIAEWRPDMLIIDSAVKVLSMGKDFTQPRGAHEMLLRKDVIKEAVFRLSTADRHPCPTYIEVLHTTRAGMGDVDNNPPKPQGSTVLEDDLMGNQVPVVKAQCHPDAIILCHDKFKHVPSKEGLYLPEERTMVLQKGWFPGNALPYRVVSTTLTYKEAREKPDASAQERLMIEDMYFNKRLSKAEAVEEVKRKYGVQKSQAYSVLGKYEHNWNVNPELRGQNLFQ